MVHLNPLFEKGLLEFQSSAFYPCHDTLEALWMDSTEPDKTFVQGILQVAVACYHLGNANERGAMILLGEGIKRLRDYQPEYETVDVTTLVQTTVEFLSMIQILETQYLSTLFDWASTASQADQLCLGQFETPIQLPQLRRV